MEADRVYVMGRGKHQLTKDKKEIKQLTKIASAMERAKRVLDRKDLEKDLPVWIRDRLGTMIEKIDPLELVSVIALTPLVKGAVETYSKIALNTPWYAYLFGVAGVLIANVANPEGTGQEFIEKEGWQLWLVSFGLTYVIVHNFGALLSAGSSIASIAGALLAA